MMPDPPDRVAIPRTNYEFQFTSERTKVGKFAYKIEYYFEKYQTFSTSSRIADSSIHHFDFVFKQIPRNRFGSHSNIEQ